MYLEDVKPVTITVPDELDAAAAAEARRRGISKSAMYRLGLEAVLPRDAAPDDSSDVWHRLGGFGPADVAVRAGDIDRELYDR